MANLRSLTVTPVSVRDHNPPQCCTDHVNSAFARELYLSYNPLKSARILALLTYSSGSRTGLVASFSGPVRGATRHAGKTGSTAHALPSVFCSFKNVYTDRSYECTQNGGHDFDRGIKLLPGRSEVNLAAAMPCRLQLCTVSGS
jgi:hypothetical protein